MQRTIVAQINQDAGMQVTDPYSGTVAYKSDGTGNAPWFDWGPYLWASGSTPRQFDQLVWCNGQAAGLCPLGQHDVRYGDLDAGYEDFWGDFTHPAAGGLKKVADQLVKFVHGTTASPWVHDWIGQ